MNETSLETKLALLSTMTMQDLREEWRRYFDFEAPKFNRVNLERRLAYHIQEELFGGLSEEAKFVLKKISQQPANRREHKSYKPLKPGAIITKEYAKREHRVTVAEKGYEYNGRLFSNLSTIATLITGTRWSGPSFFGLEEMQI